MERPAGEPPLEAVCQVLRTMILGLAVRREESLLRQQVIERHPGLLARQRFCANYGFRGLYNFDARGHEQPVPVAGSQDEDRRRSLQIAATSAAIGAGVALVAVAVGR